MKLVKGIYCELDDLNKDNSLQTVSDIENRMRKIIVDDLPFVRKEILVEEALDIFEKNNYNEKKL